MGKGSGGGGGGRGVGAAPDPYRTAMQQRGFNTQAAIDSARMNQVNQYTPWGSTYWTGEIGSPNRAQHTTFNPILGRILFGGAYHPHFPGSGPGAPGSGGGGGGASDMGLAGLANMMAQTPAARTMGQAPVETPERGGDAYSRMQDLRDLQARSPVYDSWDDFIDAMYYGIQTGDFGKQYSGTPGHGPVGRYSGPDASLARTGAKLSLGSFHPVNKKTASRKSVSQRSGRSTIPSRTTKSDTTKAATSRRSSFGGGRDRDVSGRDSDRSTGGGPGGRKGSGDRGR